MNLSIINSTQPWSAAALLVFLNGEAIADTLKMNNGDAFSGRIISLQSGLCIFDTNYGVPINVKTSDIQALATDNAYTVVLKTAIRQVDFSR